MAKRNVTRANSYGAKKIKIDGIVFASILEGREYQRLRSLEKAGVISDLELQPSFELVAGFNVMTNYTKSGKSRQASIKYTPDFMYKHGMEVVVVEVKGFADTAYKIRKRLFMNIMNQLGVDVFIEVTAKDTFQYRLIT